jgi:AcrR family transcriptional regulator
MPKVVDHNARRAELSEAVWRIIEQQGMEAVTARTVAEAAGWSLGVLSHYFPSKDSLLQFAFDLEGEHAYARLAKARASGQGVEALRAVVEETLPLDDERIAIARVWLGYMGRAVNDQRLYSSFERRFRRWRETITEALESAIDAGELRPDIDLEGAADTLMTFVDGICIQQIFEPERCSRDRQLALLDAQLAGLRQGK